MSFGNYPVGAAGYAGQKANLEYQTRGPTGWGEAISQFLTGKNPYGPRITPKQLGSNQNVVEVPGIGTFIQDGESGDMSQLYQKPPIEEQIYQVIGYTQNPATGEITQHYAQRQNRNVAVNLAKANMRGRRVVRGGVKGAGDPFLAIAKSE